MPRQMLSCSINFYSKEFVLIVTDVCPVILPFMSKLCDYLTIYCLEFKGSLGEICLILLLSSLSKEVGCTFLELANTGTRSLYNFLAFASAWIWSLLMIVECVGELKISFLARPRPLKLCSKLVFKVLDVVLK